MVQDDGRLMTWPQWSRMDDRGLARFVSPQASHWLPLPISRFDLTDQLDRQRIVAGAVYDALKERSIRYAFEKYHPSQALQTIRTPPELFIAPQEGTCLDVAALYCGLCLAYELLPILIVVDGHALAAVSLTHGVRDWNRHRPGRELFDTGPLTDAQALRDLIDEESFLAVECTGFAHSDLLGRKIGDKPEALHRTGGMLAFEQAVRAGRQQLDQADRPFKFAIDVAIAHYGWRIEPHPLESLPGAWMTNIFRLLAQAPAPLLPHLKVLDFERPVEERTRNFVGRDFIFRAIDELLENPEFSSGYILIRGEPGIGKTALISQLVKSRGYVHHFNIALQNIRSTRTFLENVCAQLIVRYQLDHATLPPEASQDSAFLSQLLTEAAEQASGRPVIVLVDALDEAEDIGLAATANRLYLPAVLPQGVFFVMTSREQMDYRLDVDRREDLYLRDDDPQNLDDVRAYIRNFLREHQRDMEVRIVAWNVDADQFIELVTEKSQGNFMYLVHVLNDIHTGQLSPETIDNIQDLPQGLRRYYQRHWRTMRAEDRDRFESIYEPVLRILATVREPVGVAAVHEWTRIETARILDVIRDWRPFLNEDRLQAHERRYRVYHASFQDFLAEEGIGLKPYHERIAETASTRRNATLSTADPLAALSEYDTKYLVAHLVAADQASELDRLLCLTRPDGRHAWSVHKQAHDLERELLLDLDMAVEFVVRRGDFATAIRYALIRGSLTGIANRAPVKFVIARARHESITLPYAITLGIDRPSPDERAHLLAQLSVLAAERGDQTNATVALDAALDAIREVGLDASGIMLFDEIIDHLPTSSLTAAAHVLRDAHNAAYAAHVLGRVAKRLGANNPEQRRMVSEALLLARSSSNTMLRSLALAELSNMLPSRQQREVQQEAIDLAEQDHDRHFRGKLFGQLASYMRADLLESLWRTARDLPTWVLEQGRWMAREHAAAGISSAAAAAGLNELAMEVAWALEEVGWSDESQLAMLKTASQLPEPLAGRLVKRLGDAVENERLQRILPDILSLALGHSVVVPFTGAVVPGYADDEYTSWSASLGRGRRLELSEWELAAGLTQALRPQDREAGRRLLEAATPDHSSQNWIRGLRFLVGADLLEDASKEVESASPQHRAVGWLAVAAAVPSRQRSPLLRRALDYIQVSDPEHDARLTAEIAPLLTRADAQVVLARSQARIERIDDAEALEELLLRFRDPPRLTPPRSVPPADEPEGNELGNDSELRQALSAAISLSDQEPIYDVPSPREEAIQSLVPRLLRARMYKGVVEAAMSLPRFYDRRRYFSNLIEAGAFETALNSFSEVIPDSASFLAEAVERLPDRLWDRWLECVLTIRRDGGRAEALAAAGQRQLPVAVFEHAWSIALALVDADARLTALRGLAANWQQFACHDEHQAMRKAARELIQSACRFSRPQAAHELAATASGFRCVLGRHGVEQLAAGIEQISRWWS